MALSLQDVLDKANKKAQTGGKDRTAKPKPGKSVWRILPSWDSAEPNVFYQAYGQHFIKDSDGKVKVVMGCQDKTFDEPCEVCDAVNDAARQAPDDATRNKILESRSTQRFLFNALQVDGEDANKVVILEVGSMLFKDILTNIAEDETILDPETGRDFVINREGQGMNTRYSLAVRSDKKSCKVPKSALMELHNLKEYVDEDFEAKSKKALAALGVAAGAVLAGSAAAGALTGPVDLDDDIPDFSEEDAKKAALEEIEEAEVVTEEATEAEKAEAEDSFGEDIDDEDIEALLADLD